MSRVLVAMSGGVDSSVCAAKLIAEGHDCIGVTMQMLPCQKSANEALDAARVCEKLGIQHITLDEVERFDSKVMSQFVQGYLDGYTPNPCILCNRELKFGYLWQVAQELGCDKIATGHYAQVRLDDAGQAHVFRGISPDKDQSYVLWPVCQETLQHVILPLGTMESKDEVRALAEKFGLAVAHKKDSQDICFIPDGHYPEFLKEYTGKAPEPGPIMDEFGEIVGTHKGLTSYTLGQRKGVGVAAQRKIYVTGKDAKTNTLFVGDNELLFTQEFYLFQTNWSSGVIPEGSVRMQICTTYQGRLFDAEVTPLEDGRAHVKTYQPIRAVCPGQSCVGYQGDEVVFGGIIELPQKPLRTAMQELASLELASENLVDDLLDDTSKQE